MNFKKEIQNEIMKHRFHFPDICRARFLFFLFNFIFPTSVGNLDLLMCFALNLK